MLSCRYFILSYSLLLSSVILGQEWSEVSIYGLERNLDAMKVSAAWSAASVSSGTIGFFSTDDMRWKAFHATNVAFGAFNSLVVLKGSSDLKKGLSAGGDFRETMDQHRKIEGLYIFNNGFNYAFIFGGWLLSEKSKSMSSPDNQLIYKGIGEGLITQGIFFLIFDTSMFFVQKKFNNSKLGKFIPDEIAVNGTQVGLKWNLN